jgi:hypothetical protein
MESSTKLNENKKQHLLITKIFGKIFKWWVNRKALVFDKHEDLPPMRKKLENILTNTFKKLIKKFLRKK